jgi:phage tail-like protein
MAPKRPAGNTSFRLELEGNTLGSFASLDGPGVVIEVLEFREGGNPIPRKLPGRTTIANVTLKRGYLAQSFFESWIQQVQDGVAGFRKNLTLVVLDGRGNETARYNLYNCWPSSWKLSSKDSRGTDVVLEEVVIAVEGFQKA